MPRRRQSLATLGRIERKAGLYRLPRRSRYRSARSHVVRAGSEAILERLPTPLEEPPSAELSAWCRSDAVVFGKFDRPGTPRLRAFQADGAGGTALKVQPYHGEEEHGIGREIDARLKVADLAPHVSPRLLRHGVIASDGGRLGYLLEELVVGHHLRRWELHELVDPLFSALADLYTAAGIRSAPWSQVGASRLGQRWSDFVDEHPEAEPLRERVTTLLDADRDVETSLIHGDPVASNVIVPDGGGIVLVDWEYARDHAVAIDLTKPVQQAVERKVALEALERVFAGLVGVRRDSYGLHEQLALPQVQMLCWHDQQRAKAKQAGRMRRYREVTEQRLEFIGFLLEHHR